MRNPHGCYFNPGSVTESLVKIIIKSISGLLFGINLRRDREPSPKASNWWRRLSTNDQHVIQHTTQVPLEPLPQHLNDSRESFSTAQSSSQVGFQQSHSLHRSPAQKPAGWKSSNAQSASAHPTQVGFQQNHSPHRSSAQKPAVWKSSSAKSASANPFQVGFQQSHNPQQSSAPKHAVWKSAMWKSSWARSPPECPPQVGLQPTHKSPPPLPTNPEKPPPFMVSAITSS